MTVKSEITLVRNKGVLLASMNLDYGDGSRITQVVEINPSTTASEVEVIALTAAKDRIEEILKSIS